MDPHQRRIQYAADITYGTNNEFGFDYLRDNMVVSADEMVQRPYNYAIVDEVDSVLIDEARTPLIISGPVATEDHKFDEMKPYVERLGTGTAKLCCQDYFRCRAVPAAKQAGGSRRPDASCPARFAEKQETVKTVLRAIQ